MFVLTACESTVEITLDSLALEGTNKYDQMPAGLFDRVKRILPLADKVADEVVCEETDILQKVIPRMFEVMHRVAKFACDYVRRSR